MTEFKLKKPVTVIYQDDWDKHIVKGSEFVATKIKIGVISQTGIMLGNKDGWRDLGWFIDNKGYIDLRELIK